MTDVKALEILSEQIDKFRKLPEPPKSFDDAEDYKRTLMKTSDDAQNKLEKVKVYLEKVEVKIKELRDAQKDLIKQNQDAIQRIFAQFKPATTARYDSRVRKLVVDQLKLAQALGQATKDVMNHRLNELIDETELVCGRVQDGAVLLTDDIDALKGCLDNWRNAKVESFVEEKRKSDEERKRREEEERRRKEEDEIRKQEEEERRKREEEERKQREKDEAERRAKEAERKAEEERQRLEEEERLRREEEERLKREKEEQIKREAEEKRLRDEEEQRRREEEEARRKAEERKKRDDERREKERIRKEAEEKAWRQDPNNWKPIVYERQCDEVDGRREYHGGINCVLASPPDGIAKDDLDCYASDEVDSVITVLEEDEKPVSSVIDVQSKKETLHSEVSSRLYIPHNRMLSPSDEIVIKVSKDGNDWTTFIPVQPTPNMSELEKSAKRMAGIEVNDFTSLKMIVISRPKSQTIIVDRPGVSVYSAVDNQVKLFVPRDTFDNKTEMRMMVQTVAGDTLGGLIKDNPSLEIVLSVSSIITLISQKSPRKSIEVDLLKSTTKQASGSRFQRGKFYQLYACRDKAWRIADVEYKGQQNNVTVSLPVGRDKVTIMELEVPANVPKESLPALAETLHTCINKTASVLVIKQKSSNPKMVAVRIIRKEDIKHIIDYLEGKGFDQGPGVSGDFKIKEGQPIQLVCTGNIETDPEQKIELEYMSYKGGAGTMFTLKVKDVYKQKDLPSFIGNIRCMLKKDKHSSSDSITHSIEMTVTLPKLVREKTAVGFVRVRFPYYLTSLASYLAKTVGKDEQFNWHSVLKSLMGEKVFETGFRNAKRKFEDPADDAILFKAILLDWMKAQQRQVDKLVPVMDALNRNGHSMLAHQCEKYVTFQKENLSDAVVKAISSEATKATRDIGQDLGIDDRVVNKCMREHKDDTPAQIEAILMEWRESDDVLQYDDANSYLRSVCTISVQPIDDQ